LDGQVARAARVAHPLNRAGLHTAHILRLSRTGQVLIDASHATQTAARLNRGMICKLAVTSVKLWLAKPRHSPPLADTTRLSDWRRWLGVDGQTTPHGLPPGPYQNRYLLNAARGKGLTCSRGCYCSKTILLQMLPPSTVATTK
jgi:hypothetical protein